MCVCKTEAKMKKVHNFIIIAQKNMKKKQVIMLGIKCFASYCGFIRNVQQEVTFTR